MMAWVPVEISEELHDRIEDIGKKTILQWMVDREYLTYEEIDHIDKYGDLNYNEDLDIPDIDTNEISTAWEYAARGDRNEALVHIERALGSEWIGRLTDV